MSEFTEKHTASRLVGAPAGYVGYDDGGKLTDKVRRQPYSVVLFDEIEKAHPDVLNLLLQLLEDGQLTDAQGRSVSFRQTIVILTSNVGAEVMMQTEDLGFGAKRRPEAQDERNERRARQALENLLRPELIGRFDAVLTFKALTRQVAGKIVDALAQELHRAVQVQDMTLELRPSIKRLVLDRGFDQARGARALRRTLQALVADPLSDVLIAGRAKPGAVLTARAEKGRVAIDVANP